MKAQLELAIEPIKAEIRSRDGKPTRGWWFAQMRMAVSRAKEWQPKAPPPPRQTELRMVRQMNPAEPSRPTAANLQSAKLV